MNNKLYWTEKRCYDAAKECDTIKEFSSKYYYAYIKSITHNWRKNYTWLKRNQECDLNEPIYCIYSYEDPENKYCYVGLTKNIIKRKSSHKRREFYKMKDGTITKRYDSVRQYFYNIGKDMPEPIILEEKLSANDAQDRENFWCNHYKENGWNLINIAKTGKGSSSIGGYPEKWTDDELIKLAIKYDYPEKLKKEHSWAYKCIRARKLMNMCFPQLVEDLSSEIWKDITGYENHYQISNMKRIKRLTQGKYRGEKLVSIFLKHDKPCVSLWKDGKAHIIQVEKLYFTAFPDDYQSSGK